MKESLGQRVFSISNIIFLLAISLLCLFPILNVLAISFSNSTAAAAGRVKLLPIGFNFSSYGYVFKKIEFFSAFGVSVIRVALGLLFGMAMTIITAYPLSKEKSEFPLRDVNIWFLFVTMIFSGGLIPGYILIRSLGLIDNIFVLILPVTLSVWNVILLLNFMRGLPKAVTESAYIDGASHWTTLWSIMVPMSKPVLATLILFTAVSHWNAWFDGLIYMNLPAHYPLQTYLQSAVVAIGLTKLSTYTIEELNQLSKISNRTYKAAQIFATTLPILCAYPFLQKYFIKGVVLGSVKE